MKKALIYSIILIAGIVFAASSVYAQEPEADKPAVEKKVVKYTCSMHPEVVQSEPGKCPKCGMDLVEKKCEKKESEKTHEHKKDDKEGCKKKEEAKENVKEE